MVTLLFVVFIAIGGTDILFALASIPAVFGVTSQPYIVFTVNTFALLGLRALFFLVTGLLDRLVYLSAGLALILAFIGVKLVLHWGHGLDHRVPEISTAVSLVVIAVVLAVTTVTSLIKSRRDPGARAHAGAVIGAPPRAAPDKERQPAAASHRPGLTEPSRTRCCAPGAARRRTPAHHHSVLTWPAPALGCMDGERAGYRVERQPRSSIGVTPPGRQPWKECK